MTNFSKEKGVEGSAVCGLKRVQTEPETRKYPQEDDGEYVYQVSFVSNDALVPPPDDRDYVAKTMAFAAEAGEIPEPDVAIHQDEGSGVFFMASTRVFHQAVGPSFRLDAFTKKGPDVVFDLIDNQLSKGDYIELRLTALRGKESFGGATHGNMASAPKFLLAEMQEMGVTLIRWQMLANRLKLKSGRQSKIRMDTSMRVWALFPKETYVPKITSGKHYVHVHVSSHRFVCKFCRRTGHKIVECPKLAGKFDPVKAGLKRQSSKKKTKKAAPKPKQGPKVYTKDSAKDREQNRAGAQQPAMEGLKNDGAPKGQPVVLETNKPEASKAVNGKSGPTETQPGQHGDQVPTASKESGNNSNPQEKEASETTDKSNEISVVDLTTEDEGIPIPPGNPPREHGLGDAFVFSPAPTPEAQGGVDSDEFMETDDDSLRITQYDSREPSEKEPGSSLLISKGERLQLKFSRSPVKTSFRSKIRQNLRAATLPQEKAKGGSGPGVRSPTRSTTASPARLQRAQRPSTIGLITGSLWLNRDQDPGTSTPTLEKGSPSVREFSQRL